MASPLATISEWRYLVRSKTGKSISRNQPKPDGSNWVSVTRETNTMSQWADPAGITYATLTR